MKKNALTIILALVAIAALIFGFTANGGKGDLQKKLDDLTAQLTQVKADAEAAATTAADELAQVKADAETAAKAAADELAQVKADAEAAAKAAADELAQAKADAEKAIEEAKAAAAAAAENVKEEATQAVTDAVDAVTETVEEVKEEATETVEEVKEEVTETVEEVKEEAAAVIDHAAFAAAALDTEVTVETYVQAKQSWWDNKATIYTQAPDGAYFIYEMAISQEEYDKLVPGTKIKVTGYKSEWAGEIEITDAKYEILEGDAFVAEAEDVTALLGTEELVNHQNEKVAFKGMTVEDYGEGAAFAYKNANDKTDDLYFKVSKDGQVYDFCVEFYLCGKDTDVYKAVENLKVGDVIDLEGFLYWYNGANPHITSVTAAQ